MVLALRAFPRVVRFYHKRATTEQWLREGQQAVKMTRLSCHRFRSIQVRLPEERQRARRHAREPAQ